MCSEFYERPGLMSRQTAAQAVRHKCCIFSQQVEENIKVEATESVWNCTWHTRAALGEARPPAHFIPWRTPNPVPRSIAPVFFALSWQPGSWDSHLANYLVK
jgi:hypothetical protein